jgi:hypothetical protein
LHFYFWFLPVLATCSAHQIPLDLIILFILGEEYSYEIPTVQLSPSATSSLFGPNIPPSKHPHSVFLCSHTHPVLPYNCMFIEWVYLSHLIRLSNILHSGTYV